MRHCKEVIRVERTIRMVMPGRPQLILRKRVAAYTRVSCGKDAMLHSLSAQVSYFSDLIQRNPEWEYVGVYSDEAMSGTKDNRENFMRMVEDCRAGKIDMIITKSLSRFARNTVTLLKIVRELKDLGVDVYFEKENIHSTSGDGELMLTILASFAQEESRSVSENCKWRIRNDFAKGIATSWCFMYGYRIKKCVVTIHEKEAAVVRWIFHQYIEGVGTAAIARLLRRHNVKSYFGGVWTAQRVRNLLKNEKYSGDMLLQKRYVVDHLTKVCKHNHGELPQYFVEGSHPAIISRETYQKAMAIMRVNFLKNNISAEAPPHYVFTQKIVCDKCGKNYRRRTSAYEKAWNCATYLEMGKAYCHTKKIPEDILMREAAYVLRIDEFDPDVFTEQIAEIRVPEDNKLVFVFYDGRRVETHWQDKSRRDSWTPEMKKKASEAEARRRQK